MVDTLKRNHTHLHAHTFTHTHDGSTHTHTIAHAHDHGHYLTENRRGHWHSLAELERAAKHGRGDINHSEASWRFGSKGGRHNPRIINAAQELPANLNVSFYILTGINKRTLKYGRVFIALLFLRLPARPLIDGLQRRDQRLAAIGQRILDGRRDAAGPFYQRS